MNFRRRVENVVRDSIPVSRNVETVEREPEPEFVPFATDRPVGLDLDEFLPVRLIDFILTQKKSSINDILNKIDLRPEFDIELKIISKSCKKGL